MKKLLLLLTSSAFLSVNAQTPFNYCDSVSINRINARVLLHGDMWWDPATEVAKCEFPKNSGKHIGYTSAIWMSGYDESSQLHVTAQTYRQDGNDYWPGPLDASGALSYAQSTDWAHFWKVQQTDIQYFLSLPTHTTTNTPTAILTWPGTGNTYAAGNAMAPLSIPVGTNMAPFVDLNGNGIYEPLLGEYPNIKGDEAVWWVYSDNGPTHNNTNGLPLGVEVRTMSYAYNRGTLMDNVVYYEYMITNKSAHTYSNCRMAYYSDADLGYYFDDYVGYDSARRMSIFYNGTYDDGLDGGHPFNSYGTHAPVQGTTLIALPGDTGTTYRPAGSFVYFNNDYSNFGNPSADVQYDRYMRGLNRAGAPYWDSFSSTPHTVSYVYPGDPSDTTQWSECAEGNTPGDRRTVFSSNDFTLAPGETVKIVTALVVTDTNQGGCPNVNFNAIREVADTAWWGYRNPPPVATSVANIKYGEYIKLFPNPAQSTVHITMLYSANMESELIIRNTLGQVMNVPIQHTGSSYEADIAQLPTGVYYLGYMTNGVARNIKFVKE
jgi:hypothetical protein